MAFSLTDLVDQIKQLEEILAGDFRQISAELRKETVTSSGPQTKLRLVEELQYHDILRQKLEHVRHFQEELLAEQQKLKEEGTGFTSALIELSLALLRFTQLEYQEVNRRASQLLFSSGQNGLSDAQNPLSFDQAIGKLIQRLQDLYLKTDVSLDEENGEEAKRFRKILDSFSMKSERDVYSMLFDDKQLIDKEEGTNDQEGQVELF